MIFRQFCVGIAVAVAAIFLDRILRGPFRALVARFGVARVVADAIVFLAVLAGGVYLIMMLERVRHGG